MTSARGLPAWRRRTLRRRGALIDAIAAAVLTGGALWSAATLKADHWVPITVVSAAVCTTSIAWRRRAPVLAAVLALTAIAAYQLAGNDTQGSFVTAAILLTCYSVGRLGAGDGRRLRLIAVLGYALAACTAIDLDSGFSVFGLLMTWVPVAVLPAAAGLVVERRERIMHDLLEAESRIHDEHAVRTARLLAEERTRVARELHDVVAHCVSVMVIQAGAARLVADADASAAREALGAVVSSGRDALTDLRRVVGVLRRSDDSFVGPAQGVAQVGRLVAGLRAGGLQVGCRVEGEPVALPPDVDLTAFRIVQEALTNVLKHAHSARADVALAYGTYGIEVLIEDTGPADPTGATAGSGHGLVGMRERVAMQGGELHAGPTSAGGFMVHARVPLIATPAHAIEAPTPSATQRRARRRSVTAPTADLLFVAAWLIGLEIEALTSTHRAGPLTANVAAVAVMALAALIRRRAPLVFLAVLGAFTVALSGGLASPERASLVGTYVILVGGYSVAAYLTTRFAAAGLAFMVVGVVLTTVLQHAPAGAALGGGLMAVLSWLVGRVIRRQRELTAALAAATARLAAEREDRALLALFHERARIARDLHTLVARLVTTMVVQSQAATGLVAADDPNAIRSICAIEVTGRQAMTHMRRMLGVLRNDHPVALAEPQPTPATIPQVVLEAMSS